MHNGHFAHGFFDDEPAVKKGRSIYLKAIPKSLVLVLVVIIWGIFPIYWGSMFSAIEHVHNLNGLIVVCFTSIFSNRLTSLESSGS